MTVRTIDEIFRDFVTDGVPASGPFNPHKPDIRDTLKALSEGSENFPDNRVIRLNNANEGTSNNIIVSASVDIPAAAFQVLYILNVTKENTGPVTVSGAINRTLVTNTSQPVPTGYLTPGMAVLCIDTGTELRMLSYGYAESVQAAAEAAAERAEDAEEAVLGLIGGVTPIFATKALAEAYSPTVAPAFLKLAGYHSPAIGGRAIYVPEASGPIQITLEDGVTQQAYNLAQQTIDAKMFGAKGDDAADDIQPILDALDYGRQTGTPLSETPFYRTNLAVHLPKGLYRVSQPVVVPAGVNLVLDPAARIIATEEMPAVVMTEEASYLDNHQFGFITGGGTIDANGLATDALWLKYFAYFSVRNIQLWSAKENYARLGSLTAPARSYEAFFSNVLGRRKLGANPAGSRGILFENVGDSHFQDFIVMGVRTGAQGDIFDSKFDRVHVWNPHPIDGYSNTSSDVALGVGFSIVGTENIFTQCQVDGPLVEGGAGWYFTQPGNALIGCSLNGDDVPDGVCFGVYLDPDARTTIVGCTFKGQDASHRLERDIAGPGRAGSHFFGNRTKNSITTEGDRGPNMSRAWGLFNGVGTVSIRKAKGFAAITDNGVGDYSLTFTEAMTDTDYSAVFGGHNDGAANNGLLIYSSERTVASIRVRAFDPVTNVPADCSALSVEIKEYVA